MKWLRATLCYALTAAVLAANGDSPSSLIVDSVQAADGAWPWQLSIRYLDGHSCGASLLGPRYATSAAHCVGAAPSTYKVIAGTNDRSCPGGDCVERQPDTADRHPDYTGSGLVGYPNDVSVLTWSDPMVEIPGKIEFALMATTEDQVGQTCYISGWGRPTATGEMPLLLHESLIDVLTVAECQQIWSVDTVHNSHVCVYDRQDQTSGACDADDGGPLVCRASDSSPWELAGSMSWTASDCTPQLPSVYSRISVYRDWILSMEP